jgi:hypothetical protein
MAASPSGENMVRGDTLTDGYAAPVAETHSITTRVFTSLSSRPRGYVPALAGFILAMVVHSAAVILFGPKLPGAFPFFPYLLAFLTAAWCGYGPGLLVTILITCGMPYLFKPGFSIRTVDVGGVTIFLLLSVIVSKTAADRRRTEALLRRLNHELDQRVAEQTRLLRDSLV